MRSITKFEVGLIASGLLSSAAMTAEVITYTYDARGRLAQLVYTGTVNYNNQACYKYGKAGNRTNVKVNVGYCPRALSSYAAESSHGRR